MYVKCLTLPKKQRFLYVLSYEFLVCILSLPVINWLDLIKELYDMYLEEEETLRIVKVVDNGLDFDLDNEDSVMNRLDPIKDLYNMYSEEEEVPWIVEIVDKDLDLDSELRDRPVDLYLEL